MCLALCRIVHVMCLALCRIVHVVERALRPVCIQCTAFLSERKGPQCPSELCVPVLSPPANTAACALRCFAGPAGPREEAGGTCGSPPAPTSSPFRPRGVPAHRPVSCPGGRRGTWRVHLWSGGAAKAQKRCTAPRWCGCIPHFGTVRCLAPAPCPYAMARALAVGRRMRPLCANKCHPPPPDPPDGAPRGRVRRGCGGNTFGRREAPPLCSPAVH